MQKANLSLLDSPGLKEHSLARSIKWVFTLPTRPKLFFHRWAFFDYVVEKSMKEHVGRGGLIITTSHQHLSETAGEHRVFDLEYRF